MTEPELNNDKIVTNTPKAPSMLDALIPIIALVVMLTAAVGYFADNSSFGPNQIALLLAMGIAIVIGIKNGHTWQSIEKAIVGGISISLGAILILLAVGSLIGTWLLSGTVPTMVYYGLQIIDPSWFYAAACLVCGIVAMSIGSSWTTAATVGVAFIGIASGFEMSSAVTAGAVISGAYFGDKLSPLRSPPDTPRSLASPMSVSAALASPSSEMISATYFSLRSVFTSRGS